ncbi:ATP-binding protein, partial [Candidatus Woesearchaeota archaeon]|nr:ATP-binding protein [Candidatus Woesearchaeota archaeon]
MNTLLTVEELCKKLKPVFGKKIEQIYLKYRLSNSMEEKKEIEQALSALYHRHLNEGLLNEKILLEPPTETVMHGEYPLGMISYAEKELFPFALREKDWVRHVCISGMSGSGKTNLAFQIVGNFIKHKKPFMIFDWKKSFRPITIIDKEMLLFTVGNKEVSNLFKTNINRPPKGVPPKEWLNFLTDLITESFFASYGVHKLISETLDKAYEEFGVYEGSENYPTWFQIKDRLEERSEKTKKKGRESEWITSALRIAHVLTFGPFGEAINFKDKTALTVESLLDKKVIFELNSLNNVEKKFFCEFILMYIYKLRKGNETSDNGRFKHAILVDEAHNIFLKDRPHFVNETTTDMIYRELREYGTSLICLDQHISKLSDTVAGNSACNIAFQQMLYKDVETVAGIMQLGEVKQYFSMLPVGSAIVKLAERYYKPFLIQVPFVELKQETVTDQEIKNMMQKKSNTRQEYEKFKQSSSIINVTKELERVNQIFKATGVDTMSVEREIQRIIIEQPKPGLAEKQRAMAQIAQQAIDKERKERERAAIESKRKIIPRAFLTNHLQAYIVDYLRAQMKKGYSLQILKQHLLNQGYKPFDILKAISHIRNVPEDLQSRTGLEVEEFKPEEQSYPVQDAQQLVRPEPEIVQHQEKNTPSYSLTQKQKQVLELISRYPYLGTAQVYQYLGLSARKGNELRKQLIDMGLLKVEEQRNEKGWKKILALTKQANTALEN